MIKVVLSLLLLAFAVGTASAELSVKVPDVSCGVGEDVNVPVVVENAQNLGSMDIVISFDPEVVKVKSVGKGELNKGILTSNVGDGVVAISFADSKGIDGDGEVAVISFEALKQGTSELKFESVQAYDVETHVDIKVTSQNGKITVEESSKEKESSPGFEIVIGAVALLGSLALRRRLN
ncbi:Cohesin domain [Geoglobus ahangari]|uniref:Cohesin domain n=1 Tax=Geoglobus ahangari TaxID=113653 RepID=A0A0F7DC03_9EURY|nr:cohesin domain-containing protein [Geoglobus ahangari]AKG91991.1 Cohesin domain [Geoglobus ahangari]